jgi:hypothetical protein
LNISQKESNWDWIGVGLVGMFFIGLISEFIFMILSSCPSRIYDCTPSGEYSPFHDYRFHILFFSVIFSFFAIIFNLNSESKLSKSETITHVIQAACMIILNVLFFVYSFEFFEIFENIFYFLNPEHLEGYFIVTRNNLAESSDNLILNMLSSNPFLNIMPNLFAKFISQLIINFGMQLATFFAVIMMDIGIILFINKIMTRLQQAYFVTKVSLYYRAVASPGKGNLELYPGINIQYDKNNQ